MNRWSDIIAGTLSGSPGPLKTLAGRESRRVALSVMHVFSIVYRSVPGSRARPAKRRGAMSVLLV